jgi:hypothetical protein
MSARARSGGDDTRRHRDMSKWKRNIVSANVGNGETEEGDTDMSGLISMSASDGACVGEDYEIECERETTGQNDKRVIDTQEHVTKVEKDQA